jgi:hypothetical protein
LVAQGQIVQDALLDVTKPLFALSVKKLTNSASQSLFDHMIRIDKWQTQAPAQLSANRRFA